MVTRDSVWPEGTPCWVDLGAGDIPKAIAFYSAVFGWDIPPGRPETGGYSVAGLGGRDAAGIGPKMGPTPPATGRSTSRPTTPTRPSPRSRAPAAAC
jgi:uncharacterized protein